jgi:hypothetical protein
MALQYQNVEEPSFSRGIDARSAENQIRDGFVRDLVNSDIVEGRVKKRKGYANYGGQVPVRVAGIRQIPSTNQICFTLDNSIDVSRVDSSPILVYGKSSNITTGQGPFTTSGDTAKYYLSWESNLKKQLLLGTGTINAPVTEHVISSSDIYVGVGESTGTLLSNELLLMTTTIDPVSYNIAVNYTNNTNTVKPVFLFYRDGQAILGENYTGTHVVAADNDVISITAATHSLSSYNIIYQLYQDTGSVWELVKPALCTVDSIGGTVSIQPGRAGTYRVLLTAVPIAQSFNGSPTQNGPSYEFTISDIESPYTFYTLYEASSVTPGLYTEILPDSVLYNDTLRQLTFRFSTSPAGILQLYYTAGTIRANEICATDNSVTVSIDDSLPQLTIYGLDHAKIYGNNKQVGRRGWTNHIDSYRSPTTTHMVTGLGGNLFSALSVLENSFPASFKPYMPTYYPRLNGKTAASAQVIGPAFWGLADVPNRTRPTLHFTAGGTNWATVTAVAYDDSSGKVDYTLSVPDAVIQGTAPNGIDDVIANTDSITIKGMSHSRHNGTFEIVDATLIGSTLTIRVTNPKIKTNDYDDTGCAGLAGIFTDKIAFSSASPFLANDIILSSAWSNDVELIVNTTVGSTTTVGQVFDIIGLTPGLTITGRRTSDEIPLRTLLGAPASANLVVGDTVYITDLSRPLQVIDIDTVNHVITVDESFAWEDNISLPSPISVAQRWIPAEVPEPSVTDVLVPRTDVRHLSVNPYGNQPFLRSAMVQNNLYLTNGDDEVYKYDGRNFYRAGMIPWQPGLFLAVESVATGGIAISGSGARPVAALVGAQLRLTDANAGYFQNGDVVRFVNSSGVNQLLTISSIATDSSLSGHKLLAFTETLNLSSLGGSPTLTLVYQARYYFRLNIKDVNGVIIASAVTGAADFVATISPETDKQLKVLLRLVGLPPWDRYDYRNKNIELEVYRTLWSRGSLGSVPVFYRIQSVGLTYEANSGYIDITDIYSNQTLSDSQSDVVVGALSPDTVPADWDEPARAKYVTTAGNRLVLANVTDWPTLTVTYLGAGTTAFPAFSGQKFLLRKDRDNLSSNLTNMIDRVTYELISSSAAKAIYPVPGTSGHFKFSATTALPVGLAPKDWVYLYHKSVSSGNTRTIAFINNSLEFILTSLNSLPNVGDVVYFDSLTTYAPTHSGGVPLDLTRGYFVSAVDSAVTTTVASSANTSATLTVASASGFPTTGTHFITVNGQVYSYNGVSSNTLQNVTPIITANSNDVVLLSPGVSISLTYGGASLAFDNITTTTSGTGTAATTVNVASTTNFPTQGRFTVGGGTVVYTYTGKTATSFTGVSPAVASYISGQTITFFTSFGSVNWDGSELDYAGWYQVADVTGGVVTIHSPNLNWSVIPTQFPDRALFATNLEDVPVLVGTDGNMGMVNGNGPLPWLAVLRRLGMAINASMRVTDTTLAGQEDFTPWLIARSESDTGGQLIVKQPRAETTTFSLTISGTVPAPTYVNGNLYSGTPVKAVTTRYPSRLLVSYNNYPEIFDNPWTIDSDFSDSAVDVNSADGQEITGIIPFFGESAFGAALQSGVLVVFKQNSIYLVDLAAKASGQNPVQRLETQGLGCTAPYSIASTKDGIAFANDSGIYVLRRNQRIEYLGRYLERLWQDSVDKNFLDIVQGHHYGVGRQYKLSVPMSEDTIDGYAENSQVYVYNHTGESDGETGGWARYTNHAATGWANLFQDAFFGTCNGTVKRLRNLGDVSDYRDDANAVESILEARATAYGNTGVRKVVASVTIHYRSGGNSQNTSVYMAPDLYQEYDLSSSFRILAKPGLVDGLGTIAGQDVVSIMHSFPKRRCIYMSVKIVNNGKDENVELAGFSYSVAGLSGAGVKQAGETE